MNTITTNRKSNRRLTLTAQCRNRVPVSRGRSIPLIRRLFGANSGDANASRGRRRAQRRRQPSPSRVRTRGCCPLESCPARCVELRSGRRAGSVFSAEVRAGSAFANASSSPSAPRRNKSRPAWHSTGLAHFAFRKAANERPGVTWRPGPAHLRAGDQRQRPALFLAGRLATSNPPPHSGIGAAPFSFAVVRGRLAVTSSGGRRAANDVCREHRWGAVRVQSRSSASRSPCLRWRPPARARRTSMPDWCAA